MKGHSRSVYGGTLLSLAMVLTLGVLIASAHDRVRTVVVDCTEGRTIAHALERGDEDKPLVVIVRGMCHENVVIDRDDVTLQGDTSGGGVTGLDPTKDTILIEGARRVGIENLTVSGGGNGIAFIQGSSGTVDNCIVQNTGGHGVRIEGASATVINSTISFNHVAGIMLQDGGNGRIGITNSNQYAGNTINSNGGTGIHLQYGATAAIGGNTITGNGTDPNTVIDRSGIALYTATGVVVGNNSITGNQGAGIIARSSGLRIGDPSFNLSQVNTISGNGIATSEGGVFALVGTGLDIRHATISGNTGTGVTGQQGSSVRIRDSTINDNAGGGVVAFVGTALDLQNTTISDNTALGTSIAAVGVALSTRSVARIRGGSIQNNDLDGISLVLGSGLFLQSPAVSVTGNGGFGLSCDGNESSYSGNTSGIVDNGLGPISNNCTGF